MAIVHFTRRTRPSAIRLAQKLRELGYEGMVINWGTTEPGSINSPEAVALASNKRRALHTMAEAGVPTPPLWRPEEALNLATSSDLPLVGRRDYHRKGRGFYLCEDIGAIKVAIAHGVTHFTQYIAGEDVREFRVHVVSGKSIKLSEKLGGGVTKNYDSGARFYYPENFNHKRSLRKVAREAVASLGLDFGAVDLLYRNGEFYVLEVNTAPCLTSTSDTLERYARAFMEEYDVSEG